MPAILVFNTDLKKRRLVGIIAILCLLGLFLIFNRIPKLDTVEADLAIATSPATQCFQGFCIEQADERSLWERWWDFSISYLNAVWIGMVFAFTMAGIAEAFIFPRDMNERFIGRGFKGILKGVVIGPVMNLCSACIVPIAATFRRRGADVGTTVAITQGSSTMNLPALIMVTLVFVPTIGGGRIALSILGAFLIGPIVARVLKSQKDPLIAEEIVPSAGLEDGISWKSSLSTAFLLFLRATVRQSLRLGPVMIIAGFASGLVIQWISPDTVTSWIGDDVLGIVVAASLGIAINVPLMFEIPLVAAMLLAGMGAAPATTLLFTAAAGGPITFWGLAKAISKKGTLVLGISTWILGVAGGLVVLGILVMRDSDRSFSFKADYSGIESVGTSVFSQNLRIDGPSGTIQPSYSPPVVSEISISTDGSDSPVPFYDYSTIQTFQNIAPTALGGKIEAQNYRPGLVIFDYDRDGDLDFYITSESDQANMLYQNQSGLIFEDVAEQAGVSAVSSNGTGAIACDVNNDGFQDLYIGSRGMMGDGLDYRAAIRRLSDKGKWDLPSADVLLLNNGNGTFKDISESAFGESINLRSAGSIACADVNNDGWLDIYVGNTIDEDFWIFDQPSHPGHFNVLYLNGQDLTFTEIAQSAGVRGPEIYMRTEDGEPIVFKDAASQISYEGYDPNAEDASGDPIGDPTGRTHSVLFMDIDGDGDQDLWLANDGDRLHLFRNDSTKSSVLFTSITSEIEGGKVGNWMGFAVSDYDGDLDLDVFVTNIGYHLRLWPPQETPGGDCKYQERFPQGTCLHFLLRNDLELSNTTGLGKPSFTDVAETTSVIPSRTMPPSSLEPSNIHSYWEVPKGLGAYDFGYGTTFFDMDNDGITDLYWLGSEGPPGNSVYPSAGRMLKGIGDGNFVDVTVESHLVDAENVDYSVTDPSDPLFNRTSQRIGFEFHLNGKGLAHGDFNGDGYVDLVGTNSSGPVWDNVLEGFKPALGPLFVWINSPGDNHWVTIRLKGRMAIDGSGSNADAVGARVQITSTDEDGSNPVKQVREVRAGSSYISMDSIDLEFGIASSRLVDEVIIYWPSGVVQTLEDLAIDEVHLIIEPSAEAVP